MPGFGGMGSGAGGFGLEKLFGMGSGGIAELAGMAAMKGTAPQLGPAAGGGIQGGFASLLGGQGNMGGLGGANLTDMGAMKAGGAGGAAGLAGAFLDANQAGVLGNMAQQPAMHYPGAAYFARPGDIKMEQIGVPQVGGGMKPSLGQLLGR